MYGRREENELEYENIYTGGGGLDWIGSCSGSTGQSDALNRITLKSKLDYIPQSHRILLYPVSTADSATPVS